MNCVSLFWEKIIFFGENIFFFFLDRIRDRIRENSITPFSYEMCYLTHSFSLIFLASYFFLYSLQLIVQSERMKKKRAGKIIREICAHRKNSYVFTYLHIFFSEKKSQQRKYTWIYFLCSTVTNEKGISRGFDKCSPGDFGCGLTRSSCNFDIFTGDFK